MKILIDVGHPGHVHLFRNLAAELIKKGHQVSFLCKDSLIIIQILDNYGFTYKITGTKRNNIFLKYLSQLGYLQKSFIAVQKLKPDFGLGVSMILPILTKLGLLKSIAFDDDDKKVTPIFAAFANFASVIFTPSSLLFEKRGSNHITYEGFHELAYLHPNRFTPDVSVLKKLNLNPDEKYFVIRFNSFSAHHDLGEKGMNSEQKVILINKLKQTGKVFITTEAELPSEFTDYKLPTTATEIHSVLFYATMVVGESQTMTSEAAIIGTPAIKCNTFAGRLSIPNELENKYGLCYAFHPSEFNKLLLKTDELLSNPNLKREWMQRRNIMLYDKIDVTAYWLWFIENYPQSVSIMKETPDYQYNFK